MERTGRTLGVCGDEVGMSISKPMDAGTGGGTADLGDLLTGLEAIIHQLPTALLVMEAGSYRIVLQSERVAQIWRISPAEVRLGARSDHSRWVAFFPDGRRYQHNDWPLVRTLESGEPIDGEEMEVVRGDGTRAIIRICTNPLFDSAGTLIAAAATIEDITEQRSVERGRRFLAEASAHLVASLSYGTTVRNVARLAVPDLADWCAVDILGEGGRLDRVAVEHGPVVPEHLAGALAQRCPPDQEAPGGLGEVLRNAKALLALAADSKGLAPLATDEKELSILTEMGATAMMIVPLVGRGRTIGALSFVSTRRDRVYSVHELDVASELAARAGLAIDNARLHHETQAASRAKSDFLAVMSHELRTPLTAIIGYAELLELGIPEPMTEGQREQIERIEVSARHLQELIEEILTVASLEAGEAQVRRELFSVRDLLHRAEVIIRPLAMEKDLRVDVVPPQETVELQSDPEKLLQVLLNLLSNAVKFTDRGGIRLAARSLGDQVELEVGDTGIGVAPSDYERIFEPFWQVDHPTTRRAGGTGLGLTISRRLIDLLGGEIRVRSEPGRGSSFIVRVPRGMGG